jgi:hypothetical protein
MMKAAFFRSGMTATQRARDQRSGGMVVRISCTTPAAAVSLAASVDPTAALAFTAAASTTAIAKTYLDILHLFLHIIVQRHCHA